MGGDEELQKKIIEWFRKNSREGHTKFYMKDVVKAFTGQHEKQDVQKAVNDCTITGTLMYWSTGSTTMLTLAENFPKA